MQKFKLCLFSPVILHFGIFPQGRNEIKASVHNSLLHYPVPLKTEEHSNNRKPRPNHPRGNVIRGIGTPSPHLRALPTLSEEGTVPLIVG